MPGVPPSARAVAIASFLLYQLSESMAADNIVTIRNLSKIYPQGEIQVTALNNISLDIAAGEFLTLMGPSGSGKSTLLHIIAGIDRPTSGECHVQGIDVTRLNESQLADWRNQNVGFVFQTFNLIPVLTAYENVELPLLLTRLSRSAAPATGRDRARTGRPGRPRAASAAAALRRPGTARGHRPRAGHRSRSSSSPTSRRAIWIRTPRRRCWACCNR